MGSQVGLNCKQPVTSKMRWCVFTSTIASQDHTWNQRSTDLRLYYTLIMDS